jgi:hypothetical protein
MHTAWHRIFEAVIYDLFTGTPFDVDIEPDLSLQQQFLDLVVIRKREGELTEVLPDGLAPLVEHNLISFKSQEEAFDAWTMNELIGHYVSYRKLVSPSTTDLLPEEQFQLFGVTARFPEGLAKQIELKPIRDGVYDCVWGVTRVRLIVIRELPGEPKNVPLHLFSPNLAQRWAANAKYCEKDPRASTLIRKLLIEMGKEDESMLPPKLQEFFRDMKRKTIEELTPEEFREFVLKSQGFRDLPAEERVKDLSDEELEKIMEARKKKAESKN